MSINYTWFKSGSTYAPKNRVFNRYFEFSGDEQEDKSFFGFEFTKKLSDSIREKRDDSFIKQEQRYYVIPSLTGNMIRTFIAAGPILFSLAGNIIFALFLIISLFDDKAEPPLSLFFIIVIWNLFWLNTRLFILCLFNYFNGAYVDREKQTISFTWHVDGNPPKNEHGHATFPLSAIGAFYKKMIANQYGQITHALCIAHYDHETYNGAFAQLSVLSNAHNPHYCFLEWEKVLRFADTSLPLPDSPDLEPFRHLDPITRRFDKKQKRPTHFWRSMHKKQKLAIEEQITDEAYDFDFMTAFTDPQRFAQKEITRPWLRWPIEQSYFDKEAKVPLWRKRLKRLILQLTVGFTF